MKGKADRIDEISGITRILDYKTGKVKPSDVIWTEDALFSGKNHKPKLIQLIAYIYMFCNGNTSPENVQAALFSFRNHRGGLQFLQTSSGKKVSSEEIKQFECEFMEWVKSIYALQKFEHHANSRFCQYCRSE